MPSYSSHVGIVELKPVVEGLARHSPEGLLTQTDPTTYAFDLKLLDQVMQDAEQYWPVQLQEPLERKEFEDTFEHYLSTIMEMLRLHLWHREDLESWIEIRPAPLSWTHFIFDPARPEKPFELLRSGFGLQTLAAHAIVGRKEEVQHEGRQYTVLTLHTYDRNAPPTLQSSAIVSLWARHWISLRNIQVGDEILAVGRWGLSAHNQLGMYVHSHAQIRRLRRDEGEHLALEQLRSDEQPRRGRDYGSEH